MKRIGFVMSTTDNEWIGGLNYLSNLLHAIYGLPDRKIEPVIIAAPNSPQQYLDQFPPFEVIRTPYAYIPNKINLLRRGAKVILRRDFLMERFLVQNRIAALSHSGHLGAHSPIPTISWIADFQHRHLPDFFEPQEMAHREKWFKQICDISARVILSSNCAQRDLAAFAPSAIEKCRILHFVSGFGAVRDQQSDLADLQQRYDFSGPYFHLPNQFWTHKNHRVVVEALALLKKRREKILVISTGHTNDRRRPEYFSEFKKLVAESDVDAEFRILGLVPYADLFALMRHSTAVINPSFFEGWSTTVEESKSMGKRVVLSDIPVHREQAPERAAYFPPSDPSKLAEALSSLVNSYSLEEDEASRAVAKALLPGRVDHFARTYEKIALEACGG